MQSHGEYVLTYLGSRQGNNDVVYGDEREAEDRKTGERYFVAVCKKIDGKYSKAQRCVFEANMPQQYTFIAFVLSYFLFQCCLGVKFYIILN